ncbi:MAG: VapC toxin family PIN domain ribonuclease, partial [Alphaproteobacteria bacterium]|nr:VapC toxin family PIN domain ribonuclease [Alphaproteobacteria bacterium]
AVLPADGQVFRTWARLMHRRSDTQLEDALIAATALTHRMVVATRNVRDFAGFGVRVENPFGAA